MNSRSGALIAAFLAALIYGINYTVAKEVMPMYVKPFGFILLRVIGATILFWVLGLFIKNEKIQKQDFYRIILAAFFGVGLNMLTFFKGLSLTTPINASVIMLTTPILVLLLSAIILKERITLKKIFGIALGMMGAFMLIIYGQNIDSGKEVVLGNILVFINATSYSFYLIIVKRLIDKYHPLSLIKWLYLIGLIFVLPFGYPEIQEVKWQLMPMNIYLRVGFVVVFTTFFAYLFNIFALTKLKPTTLSIFIYLQPVIATLYALIMGSDRLNIIKIAATILIFMGVYIVSIVNKPKQIKS